MKITSIFIFIFSIACGLPEKLPLPKKIVCGKNTTLINGKCLSNNYCPKGFHMNSYTLCVPNKICGEGTYLVENKCIPVCNTGEYLNEFGKCMPVPDNQYQCCHSSYNTQPKVILSENSPQGKIIKSQKSSLIKINIKSGNLDLDLKRVVLYISNSNNNAKGLNRLYLYAGSVLLDTIDKPKEGWKIGQLIVFYPKFKTTLTRNTTLTGIEIKGDTLKMQINNDFLELSIHSLKTTFYCNNEDVINTGTLNVPLKGGFLYF